jgi:hypothetical protein
MNTHRHRCGNLASRSPNLRRLKAGRLSICLGPKGFHANETIGFDGEVFRIERVHHVVHETEYDILHTVTLSCRNEEK